MGLILLSFVVWSLLKPHRKIVWIISSHALVLASQLHRLLQNISLLVDVVGDVPGFGRLVLWLDPLLFYLGS